MPFIRDNDDEWSSDSEQLFPPAHCVNDAEPSDAMTILVPLFNEYEAGLKALRDEHMQRIAQVLNSRWPCYNGKRPSSPIPMSSPCPLPGSVNVTDCSSSDRKKQVQHGTPARTSSMRPGSPPADIFKCSSHATEVKEITVMRMIQTVATHPLFEKGVALVIFLNALVLGIKTDLAVNNLDRDDPEGFEHANTAFTIVFIIELIIRAVHENTQFIRLVNPMVWWNLFDLLIVLTSVVEDLMNRTVGAGSGDTSGIRLLRIFRLVRVLRLLRVLRVFQPLRCMVHALINSLGSLVWCLGLQVLVSYIFGMLILQLLIGSLASGAAASSMSSENFVIVREKFGSLSVTMITLLKCIIGGLDWGYVIDALFDSHPLTAAIFLFYVVFCILCMLNIVTGVFVENSHRLMQQDAEYMIVEELQHRDAWVCSLTKVLLKGSDGEGSFNCEQFQTYVDDPTIQAYFRRIGLNVEADSAKALFEIADHDQRGVITVAEFVDGCTLVAGGARQVDVASLAKAMKKLSTLVTELNDRFIQNSINSINNTDFDHPIRQHNGSPVARQHNGSTVARFCRARYNS
eukprot:NODE_3055_length_2099_cov_14.654665.p1 GENE.NODE_3055_length_2099_cov_14.654665~~NODE_3055_length_2099_cov_14.654665.p1  ORF type:complete len:572 (+),score=73.48 NODE_3055_length_2099_cov_14.654665:144-1859(+)